MTGVLQFQSKHGVVSVEVDEAVARAAAARAEGREAPASGYRMAARSDGDTIAPSSVTFDKAMESLRAYVGSVADLVGSLDLTPEEVSLEVGLKLIGEAGFVIAKAGTEAEVKVALSWKPGRAPAGPVATGS